MTPEQALQNLRALANATRATPAEHAAIDESLRTLVTFIKNKQNNEKEKRREHLDLNYARPERDEDE